PTRSRGKGRVNKTLKLSSAQESLSSLDSSSLTSETGSASSGSEVSSPGSEMSSPGSEIMPSETAYLEFSATSTPPISDESFATATANVTTDSLIAPFSTSAPNTSNIENSTESSSNAETNSATFLTKRDTASEPQKNSRRGALDYIRNIGGFFGSVTGGPKSQTQARTPSKTTSMRVNMRLSKRVRIANSIYTLNDEKEHAQTKFERFDAHNSAETQTIYSGELENVSAVAPFEKDQEDMRNLLEDYTHNLKRGLVANAKRGPPQQSNCKQSKGNLPTKTMGKKPAGAKDSITTSVSKTLKEVSGDKQTSYEIQIE
ncbi:hypothetical protein AX774_g6281, partial [Zancudomyces culisetae]